MNYTIEVDGVVDGRWSEWFGDLEVMFIPSQTDRRHTILIARLPDQAALPALLMRVTGLNLRVVSVTPGSGDGG